MLVKINGAPYSAKTANAPNFIERPKSAAHMPTMPMSDCNTFFAHLPGHSAALKGHLGTKWVEVPYVGPPVAPQSR